MKLLDQVRTEIRKRHYSIRTEDAYCGWIPQFILFRDKKHPKDVTKKGGMGVKSPLDMLA